MDIEAQVSYWRGGAVEDAKVAAELIHEGKTRHGLFFLNLALEKALKALVTRRTGTVAPRIHNLVRLAELAGVPSADPRMGALADMNQFQLEGRYPAALPVPPSQAEAEKFLLDAEEVLSWLMKP